MAKYLEDIITGSWSLLTGMWITLRNTLRPPVTLNYPYETLPMAKRFRGHIELIRNHETGEPNCVVCMACQKACPSHCIRIEGGKPEGATRRFPTLYLLDFTTCSLCGLCVESCKFTALKFSREYNLASICKEDFQLDMLERLRKGSS